MLPTVFGVLILQIVWVGANIDESYVFPDSDDDNSLMFLDNAEEAPSIDQEIATKRRSLLDSNFIRFGRGGSPPEYEIDYENPDFLTRPTRSGTNNNDRYLRFGRNKSTFLRFGRKPGSGDTHLRFGRSQYDNRMKREAKPQSKGNSNFVRFGRNDYYMRFGRDKTADRIMLTPTSSSEANSNTRHLPRQSVMHSGFFTQLKRMDDPLRFARILRAITDRKQQDSARNFKDK